MAANFDWNFSSGKDLIEQHIHDKNFQYYPEW